MVRTTELTKPCEARIGWLVTGFMVVSVDSMTGWAEGLIFVSVDISGNTVDGAGTVVIVCLKEVISVPNIVVVLLVNRREETIIVSLFVVVSSS